MLSPQVRLTPQTHVSQRASCSQTATGIADSASPPVGESKSGLITPLSKALYPSKNKTSSFLGHELILGSSIDVMRD